MKVRLTPHQRWALDHLQRLGAERPGGWVHVRECGSPAAMERLTRAGRVEKKEETGPRGGTHTYYVALCVNPSSDHANR